MTKCSYGVRKKTSERKSAYGRALFFGPKGGSGRGSQSPRVACPPRSPRSPHPLADPLSSRPATRPPAARASRRLRSRDLQLASEIASMPLDDRTGASSTTRGGTRCSSARARPRTCPRWRRWKPTATPRTRKPRPRPGVQAAERERVLLGGHERHRGARSGDRAGETLAEGRAGVVRVRHAHHRHDADARVYVRARPFRHDVVRAQRRDVRLVAARGNRHEDAPRVLPDRDAFRRDRRPFCSCARNTSSGSTRARGSRWWVSHRSCTARTSGTRCDSKTAFVRAVVGNAAEERE